MKNSLEAELYKATALTFEGLAFAFPTSEVLEEETEPEFEAAVRVEFHGSFGGWLVLSVSGGILAGLAVNMLGAETEVNRSAQRDALGELANVICGNVLSGVAGDEETFLLDPPKQVGRDALVPPSGAQACSVRVALEGGRADVLLILQGAPTFAPGAQTS
jgi:hypothetical protein